MKKLLLLLVGLCLVLALVAFVISEVPGSATSTATAFDVSQPVRYGILHEPVTGNGILQPQEVLVIGTELPGRVVKVLHDFNDVVEEGAVLFQVDDTAARDKLAEAQAAAATAREAIKVSRASVTKAQGQRDAAQATHDDMKKTKEGMVYTSSQLRAAESALSAAKAAVEEAEAGVGVAERRLDQAEVAVRQAEWGVELTTVRVPVVDRSALPGGSRERVRDLGAVVPAKQGGGPRRKYTVLERKVSVNQLIAPPVSAQLFTLAGDLEQMEVVVQIAEADASKVARGEPVYFTVSAFADKDVTFTGQVVETRLLPTSLQGAVFFTAVIAAKNQRDAHGDWRLRPGMTTTGMDIIFHSEDGPDHKGVWLVPNAALDFQLDEAYYPPDVKEKPAPPPDNPDAKLVWVLDGSTPRPVFVKPGVTGKVDDGQGGLRSEPYTQVEWGPEVQPVPGGTYPQVIVGAPPVKKKGWLGGISNVIKF